MTETRHFSTGEKVCVVTKKGYWRRAVVLEKKIPWFGATWRYRVRGMSASRQLMGPCVSWIHEKNVYPRPRDGATD